MDSRKLALRCRELADNKKAEDIVILDVREVSSVTDYFVIASGTSEPHLRAIVDDQWVTCLHQVACHRPAHNAQSDKTDSWKWHRCSSRGVSPWNYAPGCSDSMTFLRLRTAFSDSTCMNCSNCRSIFSIHLPLI